MHSHEYGDVRVRGVEGVNLCMKVDISSTGCSNTETRSYILLSDGLRCTAIKADMLDLLAFEESDENGSGLTAIRFGPTDSWPTFR